MLKRLILFFFFSIVLYLLPNGSALAQDGPSFINLTTKNGLSSNTVATILQDRSGYVWFGTSDGLNKFDGTNVTVYTHVVRDSSTIPSNDITALLEDRSGRLWIGTSEGLAFYDAKHNTFVPFKMGRDPVPSHKFHVKALYQDHAGNIWVGTFGGYRIINPGTHRVENVDMKGLLGSGSSSLAFFQHRNKMWIGTNKGLLCFDTGTHRTSKFFHNTENANSISDNCVRTIIQDKKGQLFFGTNNGLNMLLADGKGFKTFLKSDSPSDDIIYTSGLAVSGKIWLGTESGVRIFDPLTGNFTSIKPDRRKSFGLSHKSVRSISMAQRGIIWLGTFQGGVNKLDPNLALFNLKRSTPFDAKGLNFPIVTSFATYENGIFVGTDGGGLHYFDPNTGLFNQIKIKSTLSPADNQLPILSMEMDSRKQLWIGTYQNGLFLYNPQDRTYKQFLSRPATNSLSQNNIFFVKEDSKGLLWMGTNGNGVDVYNPSNKTFVNYRSDSPYPRKLPTNGFMRSIAEDSEGNMWLGTNGSGIARFERKSGRFKLYDNANSSVSNDFVLSLLHDSKGRIWAGTNGGGLNLLNEKTGKFKSFGEADGLTNGVIHKILEGGDGLIWMSTDRGITCIDPDTWKVKNFGRANGVQDSPFVLGAGITTSNGEMYFGGQDGFNFFSPTELPTNTIVPKVVFTDLRVANKSMLPGENSAIDEQIAFAKQINLNYGQNFSISYVALNFTAPQQTQYLYKLVGLDEQWNNVGREKTAYYTNLDPGDYVFEVLASNSEGRWGKEKTTIKIHIQPPYWRTPYAYVFYVLLTILLLYLLRRRGIQRIEREFAIRQEKHNAEEQIERQQREAERERMLNNQKIKFLTNLSHEFRTPISLILAPVDKLLSLNPHTGSAGQIKMIRRNARRLLNLVNQLLDFRKIEQQELKLNLQKADLIAFVLEAAEAFQDLSERKKIALETTSTVKSIITLFDHDKLERIIFNLLSNAFKFTEIGGQVTLHLSGGKVDADQFEVFICISDTGVGIRPEILPKIFDRFFIDNNDSSILNQGSGIGLSIVKEFVELHNGQIQVESQPGKGTSFMLNIPVPLLPPEEDDIAATEEKMPDGALIPDSESISNELLGEIKLATILLVEDNEEFRGVLKDSLMANYRIIEASNGREGWQKILSAHPQLVVSDVSMPEMDGIELSQKIRLDKRTNHIPIILLTAVNSEESQIRGLKTGANDYLTKPFNFDVLNSKIANLLLFDHSVKNAYSKKIQIDTKELEIESAEVKLLNKIVKFIDENLTNPELSVDELSKQVGMSRGSLYNKLLQTTGLTPIEYIRSVKLKRALELLEKSDYNVAQIAYMTGFGTPSYFSKMFKAKFNVMPSEYMSIKRLEKKNQDL